MSRSHYRYTDAERKVIAKCVEKSPHNLSEAFRESSKLLDRSARGISEDYYRHKSFFAKSSPVVSSKKYVSSGKNGKKSNLKFRSIKDIIKYLFTR